MLSRTADSLFWLARYMERAENAARLIDMGRRMGTLRNHSGLGRRNEWPSILAASGVATAYEKASGEDAADIAQADAIPFMMLARENPSSVASCYEFARANARAARAALTQDMWESVNDAWIDFRSLRVEQLVNGAVSPLLDRVKGASAQFRGAIDSSALRDDGYTFMRLGLSIERTDNIARLLDVKSFIAAANPDGQGADPYALSAILRAAGLERAYRMVYPADYTPEHLFDFLVHNRACPRSVRAGAEESQRRLGELAQAYGARKPSHELADGLVALVDHAAHTPLDPEAAHEMLSAVIRRNNALSQQIADDYYFAPTAPEPSDPTNEDAKTDAAPAPMKPGEGAAAQANGRRALNRA